WNDYAKRLQEYDETTAEAWKKGIDTFLLYSTLFSAILTAFIIDAYKLLKPDPASDPSTEAVVQLVSILSNGSVRPAFTTSSDAAAIKASTSSIWINSLWFSALVLSLASSFIALIAKQWLDHFTSSRSGSMSGRQKAYMHCLRWDKGLIQWNVPEILGVLP
ncbi:hypothetical protein OBBRIDRAFT_694591, partial [Obba rivulosa]